MKKNRISMVVFAYYPSDVRVRRAAEALAGASMEVDVIALRGDGEAKKDQVNSVNIYRINLKRKRAGKLRYIWQWGYFIAAAFLKLSYLHLFKRYQLVHVHNMPDILVFSALMPKLTGAKLIIDLHDPMPEVFMTKFNLDENHPIIKFIRLLEKWSIKFADLVITTNISFRDLFVSRSCPPSKVHIIMNSPQEIVFNKYKHQSKQDRNGLKDAFDIMYHGNIVEMHGLDLALEAVAKIRDKISNLTLHVYNDGTYMPQIQKLVDELRIRDIVKFHGIVPIDDIAEAVSRLDVGIVPNKMTPFTNLNMPTRIFECLFMEKPVIVPKTQGISDYFDENSIYFFEPDNVDSLAEQLVNVYLQKGDKSRIVERGVEIFRQYRWELQQKKLVKLVKELIVGG